MSYRAGAPQICFDGTDLDVRELRIWIDNVEERLSAAHASRTAAMICSSVASACTGEP
jgi:hypothetical protein